MLSAIIIVTMKYKDKTITFFFEKAKIRYTNAVLNELSRIIKRDDMRLTLYHYYIKITHGPLSTHLELTMDRELNLYAVFTPIYNRKRKEKPAKLKVGEITPQDTVIDIAMKIQPHINAILDKLKQ